MSPTETLPAVRSPTHAAPMPSPRIFFGIGLTAAIFYGVWTWLTLDGNAIRAFDLECAEYWRASSAADVGFWRFMVFLTDLGGVASMTLLAIMGVIWQSSLHNRTLAVTWLAITITGAVLNQSFKEAHDRPRPVEFRDRAVLEENASYPSGHSMGSAIGFGMLGYALALPMRSRFRRMIAVILMMAIVSGIGFSRIYLRAHWFSDVIGGWSAGVAWLFLCLAWLERHRLRLRASIDAT